MSNVEGRGGGPIDPPPPSRLRVTIFSRRLLGLIAIIPVIPGVSVLKLLFCLLQELMIKCIGTTVL